VSASAPESESAARVRAYRNRLRENVVRVPIDVFPTDVSYLVAKGYLRSSARQDREAVAKAVERFLASSSIG
jgi:hypothetical protein